MQRVLCLFIAFGALIAAAPAVAEKSGGVLKVQHWDSPASMSILEEATYSTVVPVMEVMNNLVIYKQDVRLPRSQADLRPAHRAKQPQHDPSGSRRELVVERRWHGAHFQIALRCQMA